MDETPKPGSNFVVAAEPLVVVQRYVRRVAESNVGANRPVAYRVPDVDNEIARAAHFHVWLERKFGEKISYGRERDGIAYSMLRSLYATEFEAHVVEHDLVLDPTGEVLGC